MGETMFEKEKPKKELSSKQLKALAKGRAKLKAKKEGTYSPEEERKVEAIKVRQREQRLERQAVLDEKKEIDIYNKLMKKGNDKIQEFKMMKYKWLDKAPSMKEYTQFKNVLDTITEEDVLNDYHIDKLNDSMGQFVSIEEEEEDNTTELELTIEEEELVSEYDLDDVKNID